MLERAVAGALLVLSISCVRVEAYACESHDECLSREGGVCEPNLYCSYPDLDCPSGRRYSGLAGAFADRCTDPPSSTTEVDPTVVASSSTSEPDPSSTSGVDDVPERVTATGTGPTPMSGDVVWSFTYAGPAGGADVFWAIEAIGDELVVAGFSQGEGTGHDVFLRRYRGPEDEVWTYTHDAEGGTDQALAMVRGSDGGLYAAGQMNIAGSRTPWVGRWEGDGDLDWLFTDLEGVEAHDVAYGLDSHVGVVGQRGQTGAFASSVRTWGTQVGFQHALASPPDVVLDAVVAHGLEFFIGGQLDSAAYLARVDGNGVVPLASATSRKYETARIQGLALEDTSLFAVGFVTTLDTAYDGWLARFDLDGTLVWEVTRGDAGNDELEAVVIRENDIVAVGFQRGAEDIDVWVSTWARDDGAMGWSRTYPELDDGDGIARDVAILDSGDLVVAGEVQGPGGDRDGLVLRLVP